MSREDDARHLEAWQAKQPKRSDMDREEEVKALARGIEIGAAHALRSAFRLLQHLDGETTVADDLYIQEEAARMAREWWSANETTEFPTP